MIRNIPVRILRLAKCGATPLRRGFIIWVWLPKCWRIKSVPMKRYLKNVNQGNAGFLILVSVKKASPSQPRSCYPCQHGRRLRYSGMIAAFMLFMLPFAPMCPTCPHQTTASRWWIAVFTILIIWPFISCSGWTMRLIDYRRRDRRPIQDGWRRLRNWSSQNCISRKKPWIRRSSVWLSVPWPGRRKSSRKTVQRKTIKRKKRCPMTSLTVFSFRNCESSTRSGGKEGVGPVLKTLSWR